MAYNDVNLEKMKKEHFSYIYVKNNKINVSIDSYFNIQSSCVLQVSRSNSGPLNETFLNDNSKHDKLVLHQTVRIGDSDSLAEEFWNQLIILDLIKEDIVAYQESEDISDLVYRVATGRLVKLV